MKKLVVSLCLILFAVSCTKQYQPGPINNADDLLKEHAKATGLDNLLKYKTLECRFITNLASVEPTSKEYTNEIFLKKPFEYGVGTFCGKDTLFKSKNKVTNDTTGQHYFFKTALNYIAPLFGSNADAFSSDFVGKINVDGMNVYRLKWTNKKDSSSVFYFDFDTYTLLLIRQKFINDNEYTYYSEYTETNGFKFPLYCHRKLDSWFTPERKKIDEYYYRIMKFSFSN